MAIIVVTKPDGTMWNVDDTQWTAKLPDQPPVGSYAVATTATGTEEYARRASGWVQADDATQTVRDWPFVVGRDTGGHPTVVFTPLDRDDLRALIQRVQVDGASVLTTEGNRLRCQSNPAGGNVTAQFGATVNHLPKVAAVRFALGLLGSVGALIGQGPV
jgi:hypothetical protein